MGRGKNAIPRSDDFANAKIIGPDPEGGFIGDNAAGLTDEERLNFFITTVDEKLRKLGSEMNELAQRLRTPAPR
ncbi:hypothetical protein [Rhodopila sp.]|uniref:hypothetical protein n=1 Tax=Rhodopila sp. TaxID=2480087 RepID=UPI003D13BFA5